MRHVHLFNINHQQVRTAELFTTAPFKYSFLLKDGV